MSRKLGASQTDPSLANDLNQDPEKALDKAMSIVKGKSKYNLIDREALQKYMQEGKQKKPSNDDQDASMSTMAEGEEDRRGRMPPRVKEENDNDDPTPPAHKDAPLTTMAIGEEDGGRMPPPLKKGNDNDAPTPPARKDAPLTTMAIGEENGGRMR